MPADRNGQRWTREETLTAFMLYMHLPRGLFHKRNADIIALSKVLERVPSSVARKLSNIEHFAPTNPWKSWATPTAATGCDPWDELAIHGDDLINEAVVLFRSAMGSAEIIEYNGFPALKGILEGKGVNTTATMRLTKTTSAIF